MRPASLSELIGQEHLLGPGSALRALDRGGPAPLDGALRAARERQDHARPPGRGARGRRLRGGLRREAGRPEVRAVIERADAPPADERRADALLPRRDPPLQQGPAGRPAPRGRGGPRHADRGDHREPLLRGQLRAALARAGLRAPRARRRRRARAAAARAGRRAGHRRPAAGRRRGARVPGRALGRRRPHRAGGARAGGRDRRRSGRSPSSWPRTRCSAARSSTTRAATATTTRSRPGSRRRAAPTRTPRCSTWR